jgi:hypothetical protein
MRQTTGTRKSPGEKFVKDMAGRKTTSIGAQERPDNECPLISLSCGTSHSQRMSTFLKVFRCGPLRDRACQEVAARVDKPRKDEAAGGLMGLWGKCADGRWDGCFGGSFGVFHGGWPKGIAYL